MTLFTPHCFMEFGMIPVLEGKSNNDIIHTTLFFNRNFRYNLGCKPKTKADLVETVCVVIF